MSAFRSAITPSWRLRGERSDRRAGEPDRLRERLEPVRELDLVALGAAEKLDPPQAQLRSCPQRLEGRDEPGRVARQRRVEPEAVADHHAVQGEDVVKGGRPSVDAHQDDADEVCVGKTARRGAVELAAGLGPERRAVRSSAPAELMQLERLLERRLDFLGRTADHELDRSDLAELAKTAPVEVALLRARLRRVGSLPTVGHLEDRRVNALDEPRLSGGSQVRRRGEAVEVGVVERLLEQLVHEQEPGPAILPGGKEEIAERRLVGAEEPGDPNASCARHVDRRGPDQPALPLRNGNGQRSSRAEMPPPFDQPAVEEERARPRHRADEVVPVCRQRFEAGGRRDRLDGAGGVRLRGVFGQACSLRPCGDPKIGSPHGARVRAQRVSLRLVEAFDEACVARSTSRKCCPCLSTDGSGMRTIAVPAPRLRRQVIFCPLFAM